MAPACARVAYSCFMVRLPLDELEEISQLIANGQFGQFVYFLSILLVIDFPAIILLHQIVIRHIGAINVCDGVICEWVEQLKW